MRLLRKLNYPNFALTGTAAAGVKYLEWGSPAAAANAVNGAKVADNSLTGADVDESTLTQVPSADFATNAIVTDVTVDPPARYWGCVEIHP